MNNLRALSLAVFATSCLFGISLYQVINEPVGGTGLSGSETRVSMFVQPLDLQPLFPRPDQDHSED